jgi:hypothetical protein
MPKATLTFNLDDQDDVDAHYNAINGLAYRLALGEVQTKLRSMLKYEQYSDETVKALEEVRQVLFDAREGLEE